MDQSIPVRTRMAPSPTGEYHIGHIRTLLYNYAFARQNNGQFIIRIEDTDQKRFVPGATEKILQVIKDYGLSWDEGPDIGGPYAPYVQTKRLDIYKEWIQKLLGQGGAYHCFCTPQRLEKMRADQAENHQPPKYDRHCLHLTKDEIDANLKADTPHVIRLKVPDSQIIKINDLVRGEIEFNTNDVDDQILIKSDGIPTYHFAAGVDDHLMNITHVLRGDEWISSLPKQYLIYKYFGWDLPQFAHLTVFLDPSGSGKMSKRKGSVSARGFLEEGYLPEAMLNFLMLLGWNPGTEQELFTLSEFIKAFDIKHLHTKQPVFDRQKLDYINGLYIRQKTDQHLAELLKQFLPKADNKTLLFIAPLLKERLTKLSDAVEQTKYLFEDVNYEPTLFVNQKLDLADVKIFLIGAKDVLANTDFTDVEKLKEVLLEIIANREWNTGKFFMAFRIAISGSPITPPIVETLPLLGHDRTLSRLDFALSLLH